MNQKIKEQWVIPTFISLGTGVLLIIPSLYINALATGVPLHSPFTLGWIRTILFTPLPLWIVLLVIVAVAATMLALRQRAKSKLISDTSDTEAFQQFAMKPDMTTSSSPASADLAQQAEGESLLISSPDQFAIRISTTEDGGVRGIQLRIENYRLTSIYQLRVILVSACSFDSRHGAFREPALTGQTFTVRSAIRPSSAGEPILIVWKAEQWDDLVTGENNFFRRLPWPNMDTSPIEKWKLSLSVFAFDRPANPSDRPISFKEINADIVMLWNRSQNVFQLEESEPHLSTTLPLDGKDGTHRKIVRYIMCGKDQLLAYTSTRDGLPGVRFLVVRMRPEREPQSIETPDRAAANSKWNEWRQEWKRTGFGGASGNGLDGEPPF